MLCGWKLTWLRTSCWSAHSAPREGGFFRRADDDGDDSDDDDDGDGDDNDGDDDDNDDRIVFRFCHSPSTPTNLATSCSHVFSNYYYHYLLFLSIIFFHYQFLLFLITIINYYY